VLTRIIFPTFVSMGQNRDHAEVRRRQREIALALAVYRSEKGRYPQKMKELDFLWGKKLPLDPYTNKPFVYRRDGQNFLLYSVGANRRDNKGRNLMDGILGRTPINRQWEYYDDLLWGAPRR